MTKLPRLYQRKRDGKAFGAWYVDIKAKPVNLRTNKRPVADKRRREAVRGVRQWPRDWDALDPIRSVTAGTVDENLAALGDVANDSNAPLPLNGGALPDAGGGVMGPPPASVPVIDPEPLPTPPREEAGAWAADLNAPAADAQQAEAPPPVFRLQDAPWFKGALVTLSKAAVGLQLTVQAWTMKLVGDVEAGRVGPPPKLQEPDGPASMTAFMAAASEPWSDDDPREPGRRSYESTIVMLIPQEIALPAWIKWLEAPVITGMNTIPVQLAGARKIKRDADGKEVPPAPDAAAPSEAPPGERAAA